MLSPREYRCRESASFKKRAISSTHTPHTRMADQATGCPYGEECWCRRTDPLTGSEYDVVMSTLGKVVVIHCQSFPDVPIIREIFRPEFSQFITEYGLVEIRETDHRISGATIERLNRIFIFILTSILSTIPDETQCSDWFIHQCRGFWATCDMHDIVNPLLRPLEFDSIDLGVTLQQVFDPNHKLGAPPHTLVTSARLALQEVTCPFELAAAMRMHTPSPLFPSFTDRKKTTYRSFNPHSFLQSFSQIMSMSTVVELCGLKNDADVDKRLIDIFRESLLDTGFRFPCIPAFSEFIAGWCFRMFRTNPPGGYTSGYPSSITDGDLIACCRNPAGNSPREMIMSAYIHYATNPQGTEFNIFDTCFPLHRSSDTKCASRPID